MRTPILRLVLFAAVGDNFALVALLDVLYGVAYVTL